MRARTSSGSSTGSKNVPKNVEVEEAHGQATGEESELAIELTPNYQQEEVGVRSREKSFESKNKLQSPSKLSAVQRKFSSEIA